MSCPKKNGATLKQTKLKVGVLSWSRNGKSTGRISIHVNTQNEIPYIELDYKYNDKPRNYKISLVSIPSNLGKGEIWYFLCSQTNKQCRKLYSVGGYFLHREAFKYCMYECQTKSKHYRRFAKTFGVYYEVDKIFKQINSKHFKTQYAGKPTKKYLKLWKQALQVKQINPNEFIQFFKR